jgi:hypothetical protein
VNENGIINLILFFYFQEVSLKKITIYISDEVANALKILAEKEYRDPRLQVMFIIRQELEQQGLLNSIPEKNNGSNKIIRQGEGK